jgi:hypothetical protein
MSQAGPITLAQRATNTHVRALVYGASGVGKTVFACASQRYVTLLLDVDDGAQSAAAFKGDPDHGTGATRRDAVITWRVTSSEDFDAAIKWLAANQQRVGLVVVDTATELQRLLMAEVCSRNKRVIPDQKCWGEMLILMEGIARSMRHVPVHVVWTAHEKGYTDVDSGRVEWKPNFAGDFAVQYAKHFDLILRYVVQDQQTEEPNTKRLAYKSVRALNCNRDAVTEAKDRFQVLPKWIHPNLDDIIEKCVTTLKEDQ